MLHLVGSNLGERHKCLNSKINSAVERCTRIDKQENVSDVEELLNIGIASKNKDINFILDILKSGNELYISKALKSVFMYNAEYSNFINPEYLTANIFPHVSLRMKRKILKAISGSGHLQEQRAEYFFDYCMKNQLLNNATKFFISTSDLFKLKFINNEILYSNKTEFWNTLFPVKQCSRRDILKFVCGNSFELAEAFLANNDKRYGDRMLHDFRYLYFVSDEKYLSLLEKFAQMDCSLKIGLRISKDITIKHKNRILKQPLLYALKLRSEMLMKHSSQEEVKIYAAAVLPNTPGEYWDGLYSLHSFYNVFPDEERFDIIKDIFAKKYPEQEFENNSKFVETKSFRVMSTEKRQAWALNKINIEEALPEGDKHYEWYKYLNIDTALEIVKEKLPKIQNCFKRREVLLNIVESCATPQDIEKLLQYYHNNHKNDFVVDREYFLNKVITSHDKIFEYEDNVWTLLLDLLLDEDLLSLKSLPPCNFETIITLYHMLHNKPLPSSFEGQYTCWHTWEIHIDRLNEEQKTKVFQVLLQILTNKLLELETKPYDQNVQNEAHKYVTSVLSLLRYYRKTKSDIPEIVHKFAKLDWNYFCDNKMFLYHEADFNKGLKENVDRVKPSEDLKEAVLSRYCKPKFNLIKFLRNLKIYFANDDIMKDYKKFFKECLVEHPNFGPEVIHDLVHFAVLGIFLLGTPAEINNFMMEHVPAESTEVVKFGLLSVIREAITRLAYRAPSELNILKILMRYVRGGYLHYYLRTLPSHVARLPLPLCLQLLEALLECVLERTSGKVLRPLFNDLNEADLQLLVTKLWDNNRSARHRRMLYTALLFYLRRKHVNKQIKLYNMLLKPITLSLCESDNTLIRDTFRTRETDECEALLPEGLRGLHVETVWKAAKLGTDEELKHMVIKEMVENISMLEKEVVEEVVEGFVKEVAERRVNTYDGRTAKWELLATYLIYYTVTVEDIDKGLLLASNVINLFLESRSNDNWRTSQVSIDTFIDFLTNASITTMRQKHSHANQLLEHVADLLKPIQNHYSCAIIKLATIVNTIMDSYDCKLRDEECDVEVVCRDSQQLLAAEVCAVVEELVSKLGYETYKSVYNNLIVEKLEGILLQISDTLYEKGRKNLRWYDLVLFFCKGLVNFEKSVTHILALRLLPRYSIEKRKEEYEELLEQIDTFEDAEVRTLLNKNFSGSKRIRLETAAAV